MRDCLLSTEIDGAIWPSRGKRSVGRSSERVKKETERELQLLLIDSGMIPLKESSVNREKVL